MNDHRPSAIGHRPSAIGHRWVWLIVVLLAIGVSAGWMLLRPRASLPWLPALSAGLTLNDFGLGETNEIRAAEPKLANPLESPDLPTQPVTDAGKAQIQYEAGMKLANTGEVEKGLAYLEAAIKSRPTFLRYSNDYRLAIIRSRQYSRSVDFFTSLVKAAGAPEVHLQLALAYVDKMAECPAPPNGMVCQAKLSNQSIAELDKVLQARPYHAMALYAHGLNNLYWPHLMNRLPRAVGDLSTCVAIERAMPDGPRRFYADAYVALGDALVKDGNVKQGWAVWEEGRERFPESAKLRDRLALDRSRAVEQVRRLRGLGVVVDTDLSIFW
jgi:tetratricopeptide (TPR) repeat protein